MMANRDHVDPASVGRFVDASFKPDVVREVLCSSFADSKSRLGGDALSLVCEIGKLLVVEGALRASTQALRDGSTAIDVDHVEKCLPQLMLDFP